MTPFGRWMPERLLGQGATAAVWLCHREDGERAAVKWLHGDDPAVAARFAQEARLLSTIDHLGIVRFRETGSCWGRMWMAMDFVEAADLRLWAEKARSRPPDERAHQAREMARCLALALAELHRMGRVHRDVKPANVLRAADGRPVLIDLGAVGIVGTTPAGAVGTRGFAAPEQLGGAGVDPRADQFGLGSTLHVLLTGRAFEGRPPSQLDPTVPADLDAVVLRLCAADPDARYADMAEVAAELDARSPEGLPLAGRQDAIDAVASALDGVAGGVGLLLRVAGARGSGRRWLAAIARQAAARRGVPFVATDEHSALAAARARLAAGERLLVMTAAPTAADRVIELLPLSVADLRRTLIGVAPRTPEPAREAERLHRLTGGNPAMVVALIDRYRQGDVLEVPADPQVDERRWLEGMDPDESTVAAALAVLPGAADLALIEQIALVPADAALPALVARGVAARAGSWWALAAEALRRPLLARSGEEESLRERAAVAFAARAPREEADPVLLLPASAIRAALAEGGPTERVAARWLALGGRLWETGDVLAARAAYREARARTSLPHIRSRAAVGVGISAMLAGDLDEALDALSAAATDASLAREADREAVALLDLCEARALAGEFDAALTCGRRALALAQGLRDRGLECAALRHLGVALLEAGRPREAAERLAEASALARATGDDEERIAAHVLRARAAMDERPGDRGAASAALDRLLPLLGERGRDPEGFHLLMRATWARAAATLGDVRQYQRAVGETDLAMAGARIVVRRRAEAELARAAACLSGGAHA